MLFEFPWFEDWVIPERTFLPFLVIFFLKLDETAVFWFVGMICCLLSFRYFGEEQSVHVCVFWEGMNYFLCVSGLYWVEDEKSKMIYVSVVLKVANRTVACVGYWDDGENYFKV